MGDDTMDPSNMTDFARRQALEEFKAVPCQEQVEADEAAAKRSAKARECQKKWCKARKALLHAHGMTTAWEDQPDPSAKPTGGG